MGVNKVVSDSVPSEMHDLSRRVDTATGNRQEADSVRTKLPLKRAIDSLQDRKGYFHTALFKTRDEIEDQPFGAGQDETVDDRQYSH